MIEPPEHAGETDYLRSVIWYVHLNPLRYSVDRAEELIATGLECFGLEEEELKEAKGGNPRRLLIAGAIWKQTTVGQGWIAQRLGMRTAGNVSQQLRRGLDRAREGISKRQLKKWEKLSRFVT